MKIKNQKGLVLTEALMTIALLSVASTIMGGMYKDAISATTISKDYLTGRNFAIETMESLRNIRDTNWLKHPANKDCWLLADPYVNNTNCSSGLVVKDTNYKPVKMADGRFKLESVTGQNLDLEKNPNDKSKYKIEGDFGGASFYRSVQLLKPALFNKAVAGAYMRVIIEWERGNKTHKLSRDFVLYNYIES